ncbi:MAG: glycosyltransferase, partial [Limisphaerales bacterium]
LPALLVPFPAAADNHQYFNAVAFENSGAAKLLEQKNATSDKVAALLAELMENEAARSAMRSALAQWHTPRAAEQIAGNILGALALAGFSQVHARPGDPPESPLGAPAPRQFSTA